MRGFFAGSEVSTGPRQARRPQCGTCGLFRECKRPKLKPTGAAAPRVLLVYSRPRAAGQHGSNQAERYMERLLARAGISPDLVASTSATICAPPRNRPPTAKEVIACRPACRDTIRALKPAVIIPLGQQAASAVLQPLWRQEVGAIDRWQGWQIPSQELNAWVCPTYAPEWAVDEEDVVQRRFEGQVRAALAHTEKPWPHGPPDWGRDVKHVTDPEYAAKWLRKCASVDRGAIAWDYETTALKPDDSAAQIVSCAVAWGSGLAPERCISFPWVGAAREAMGELLRSPIPKIGANLKFEDRFTRAEFGHRVRNWVWDTVIAGHVLDNRKAVASVKFQAFARLGVEPWNSHIEKFLKSKGDEKTNAIIREISTRDLLQYNGLDAILEYRVAASQIQEMGIPTPWN